MFNIRLLFLLSFLTPILISNAQTHIDTIRTPSGDIRQIIEFKGQIKTISKYNYKGMLESKIAYLNKRKHGAHILYYPTEKIKLESFYKNDLLTGKHQTYYEYGQLKTVSYYKIFPGQNGLEGKRHGDYIEYYANGNISKRTHYTKGELNGLFETFGNDGKPLSKITYNDGNKAGEEINYYSIGGIKSVRNIYEDYLVDGVIYSVYIKGTEYKYYENGNLSHDIDNEKGQIKVERKHYENGILNSVATYKGKNRDVRHYIGYDELGKIKTKYVQKKVDFNRNGYYVFKYDSIYEYYEAGQLLEATEYKNGRRHGNFTYYHKNGQISQSGRYKHGELIGKHLEYHANGQLKSESQKIEIQNWNKSYRIVASGWKRSYSEEGKLLNSTFHKNGKDIYKFITSNTTCDYLIHEPEGLQIMIEYYPNGSPSSLTCRFMGHGFTEYFLINGQSTHFNSHWNGANHTTSELQIGTDEEVLRQKLGYYSYRILPDLKSNTLWLTDIKDNPLTNPEYTTGPIELKYKTGQSKLEFRLKNGLIDGDLYYYSPDGTLIFKGQYKDGISDGTSYTVNLDGDTIMYKTFNDGKVIFSNELETGGIRKYKWFDNLGGVIKAIDYGAHDKIRSYSDKLAGIYKDYWESGILKSETGPYAEDSLLTYSKSYYDNGILEHIGYRKKGKYKFIGIYKGYFRNGQLKRQQFSDEKGLQGEIVTYNEYGEILNKGVYINGKKEGLWFETEKGVKKEVLYENNIGQLQNSFEKCYCIDTAYTLKHHLPSRLMNLLDYKTYKKMHIDVLESFSKEDYEHIYMKQFNVSKHSTNLNLIFFKKMHLDLKGEGESQLVLNPCFTKGYPTKTRAYYKAHPSNLDFRSMEFYDLTAMLRMDVSKIKSLNRDNIDFTFTTNKLAFSEKTGVRTAPYMSDFCFSALVFGALNITKAKGCFLQKLKYDTPKVESQKRGINPSVMSKEIEDIKHGVTGAVLEDAKGYINLKDETIDITKSTFHITETYISGQFNLPLYTFYKDNISLLSSKYTEINTSINALTEALIKQGFTNAELEIDEKHKLLNIKFIITE